MQKELKFSYFSIYISAVFLIIIIIGFTPPLLLSSINRNIADINESLLTVVGKTDHLVVNAKDYDYLIYGDSRAYLGVSAELLSNLTNQHMFNYASMAHWFETQYLQLDKLDKSIENQKIIWLIGEINFLTPAGKDKVNNIISMDIISAINYLSLGFTPLDIYQNLLLSFLPNNHLLTLQDQIQIRFNTILEKPLVQKEQKIVADNCQDPINKNYFKTSKEYGKNGTLAGCFYYLYDGQLQFVENDKEYLRDRQNEWEKETDFDKPFVADHKSEKLFEMILDKFKKHNVDLIVLQYKDAPYQYQSGSIKTISTDSYMKQVAKKVESYGYRYITLDFDEFTNDDYFDYNHLNDAGSQKLTKLIARTLKSKNAI